MLIYFTITSLFFFLNVVNISLLLLLQKCSLACITWSFQNSFPYILNTKIGSIAAGAVYPHSLSTLLQLPLCLPLPFQRSTKAVRSFEALRGPRSSTLQESFARASSTLLHDQPLLNVLQDATSTALTTLFLQASYLLAQSSSQEWCQKFPLCSLCSLLYTKNMFPGIHWSEGLNTSKHLHDTKKQYAVTCMVTQTS